MNPHSIKGKTEKLFTFFGSDVNESGAELLQEVFSKGYTLLALDVSAIGLAAKARIPYILIDDWIDEASMLQARKNAMECEQKWFQAARDKFSSDGVCWPEFDHHAMHWFWADAMLAIVFAEALRARRIQEVRFLRNHLRRPAVYYYPSDICSSLWEAKLPGVAKSYELPQMRFATSQKPLWSRACHYARRGVSKVVRFMRKSFTGGNPTVVSLNGKVVLAFNPDEFYRFTPIIQQLCRDLPGRIAAAILSPDQATADRIAAEWSIPVVCGPPCVPADFRLGQQFLNGYTQALHTANGQLWQEPLKHLSFHFKHYCTQRWPMLVANLRFWSEFWSRACPKVVIVSQLLDSESQLPAEAAKQLDIPTLSVPHGAVIGRPHYVVPSDHILYSFSIQKSFYERSGVPAHRLMACRDVVVESEYPVIPAQMDTAPGVWRLLALTDPIGLAGCFSPTTSPTAQLTALRTLGNPPADIAGNLSIRIKVHPGYSDLELFVAIGGRIRDWVLPINSELKSVLQGVDLIVAINYSGSALVHVLRAGKPVIFFWTDPLIGKIEPLAHADMFLPAGMLVREAEEFWSVIRNFFTDPKLAKEMRLRAQKFSRNYLDDSNYPSISEVVNQVLQKRVNLQAFSLVEREDGKSI